MSLITYNGVTLPYALTTSFRQTAEHEESNTDWYLTRYDISVQTVINLAYLNLIAPDLATGVIGPPTNPADVMAVVHARLLRPRRAFSMTFNDVPLIPTSAGGAPGTVDADNGPKPRSCTYTLLTNTTFLVTWSVSAAYWINPSLRVGSPVIGAYKPGSPVLYNRWSETVTYDNCLYTTRTRTGKYVIRSDNQYGATADAFREQMAVLSCPAGFLRRNSQYRIDPGGLGIEYSIVDQEQFKMPPPPAYEAEGSYTETHAKAMAYRTANVAVRLRGAKGNPTQTAAGVLQGGFFAAVVGPGGAQIGTLNTQDALINAALTICFRKIRTANSQGGAGSGEKPHVTLGTTLKAALYDNGVEVQMQSMLKNTKKRVKGQLVGANLNTYTPLSDGVSYQPAYFPRGSWPWVLTAAAYYDPTLGAVLNPTTGQLSRGLVPGQAGQTREA